MARETWTGSSTASTVVLTQIPANEDRYEATKTEVENARDGEATLLAQINSLQAQITALSQSNGSLVSSDDTTAGYLDGKLIAGNNMIFTVGSPAGNETLTIESDPWFDNLIFGG